MLQYNVGDFVYSWKRYKPGKLDWRYQGPFEIVEKITEQTYKLLIHVGTCRYKVGKEKGTCIIKPKV